MQGEVVRVGGEVRDKAEGPLIPLSFYHTTIRRDMTKNADEVSCSRSNPGEKGMQTTLYSCAAATWRQSSLALVLLWSSP